MTSPVPPGNLARHTGMHWLREAPHSSNVIDPLVALQWNPGSETWTHSGRHDTVNGKINAEGMTYIASIPYPDLEG